MGSFINVKEDRNYWLIRTEAGEYYDEFYHDEFVGMGWDDLNKFSRKDHYDDDYMSEQVSKIYPKVKQTWRVYTQIRKFIYEIKIGDIVLIPSKSHISFGYITSNVYYQDTKEFDILEGFCPFKKRRSVEWIKTIKRDDLDPYLYKLLNSHFTISNANDYSSYIDRTLHGFYIKNGESHLVLRVKKQGKVYLREINKLTDGALDLIDLFNEVTESNLDSNRIESKMNVQSPGPVELIGIGSIIITLGLLLHYTMGGKFSGKASLKSFEINGETDGLLEKIIKFKKHSEENSNTKEKLEAIKDSIKKLDIDLPDELKDED